VYVSCGKRRKKGIGDARVRKTKTGIRLNDNLFFTLVPGTVLRYARARYNRAVLRYMDKDVPK